jgi:transcription initiation factor IIE alpha subunit
MVRMKLGAALDLIKHRDRKPKQVAHPRTMYTDLIITRLERSPATATEIALENRWNTKDVRPVLSKLADEMLIRGSRAASNGLVGAPAIVWELIR